MVERKNKIDFAVIPPLANLELMQQGRFIFALAQLYLRHDQYADYLHRMKEEGWYIRFDNGTGDHDLIDTNLLLDLTEVLLPDEVIAPDILNDKHATIEGCKQFVDQMESRRLLDKVDIFFCPQGNNQSEWLEAYQFALDNPYIKTIGMSKLAIPHCWLGKYDDDQNIMEARHKCYDFLLANDLLHKPLHFLGAGNPVEFLHYDHPMVKSTDSCFSILAAINNLNWKSGQTQRIPTPKNYFTDLAVLPGQLNLVRDNIEFLAAMCNHDPR